MGTHVEPVQPGAGLGELPDHLGVCRMEQRFREVAPGDTGLIGDHDRRHAGPIQPPDGLRGAGQEADTADVIDIPHLLGEAAVAVDEDGGAVRHRGKV